MKESVLSRDGLTQLHRAMADDFPSPEIKPLALLQRLFDQGVCRAVEWTTQGRRVAYAIVERPACGNVWLLDYLAVTSSGRGQGVGSQCLAAMRQWPVQALMIEIERVADATTPQQHEERLRRRRFYLKNGAVPTGVSTRADGGLCYEILCLPVTHTLTGETASTAMHRLYETLFSPGEYAVFEG